MTHSIVICCVFETYFSSEEHRGISLQQNITLSLSLSLLSVSLSLYRYSYSYISRVIEKKNVDILSSFFYGRHHVFQNGRHVGYMYLSNVPIMVACVLSSLGS